MSGKKWFQSRTLWVAVFQMLGGAFTSLADAFAGGIDWPTFVGGLAVAVLGLIQFVLRLNTDKAIV